MNPDHFPNAIVLHPQTRPDGSHVKIDRPSAPSPLAAWGDPSAVATVVPNGLLPETLNGIALQPWADAPHDVAGWSALADRGGVDFFEPPFVGKPGHEQASGVVVEEADDRIWLVAPTHSGGTPLSPCNAVI